MPRLRVSVNVVSVASAETTRRMRYIEPETVTRSKKHTTFPVGKLGFPGFGQFGWETNEAGERSGLRQMRRGAARDRPTG